MINDDIEFRNIEIAKMFLRNRAMLAGKGRSHLPQI